MIRNLSKINPATKNKIRELISIVIRWHIKNKISVRTQKKDLTEIGQV